VIITIFMKGAPRSEQFDDIYFSRQDGVEETQHVFLNSNNLPQAWEGKENFVIAETGFGTGLNFLCAWKLFEETALEGQSLDFISVEKYPLTPEFIKEALAQWDAYFEGRLDVLCVNYPLRIAGFHRIKINAQITLTLVFDDILEAFPQIDANVDCWFLDGFTPSKNPDMWSGVVFEQMARLSNAGASYATFTAAGDVRRGLSAAGFSVEKIKGYGHKRDMVVGKFLQGRKNAQVTKPKRIAIIGGGLAGTSCAYTLKKYGFEPVIYEAADHLAAGASGNVIGLYNPRFTAQRDAISNFFAPAYAQFERLAKDSGGKINYNSCGALHLITSPEKEKRFQSLIDKWQWHDDHARIVDASEASEIAGVQIDHRALFLPDSGSVSPAKLCEYYARDIEVHLNTKIEDLAGIEADAIILCNAAAAQKISGLEWLPLETVRGQVSVLGATDKTTPLKCNIHYGGYMAATSEGAHMTGATFQKWHDHIVVVDEDHQMNIDNLKAAIPAFVDEDLKALSGRAGLRAASKDRFPLVGSVPDMAHTYLSTAFGSHGLVGSLTAAHYLADMLRHGPKCLPIETLNALNPKRFIDRELKKSRKNVRNGHKS
jgi:tRNA 5-methylaminomethyl-2-thiouridine biosynthesis bifunctional protein